MLSLARLSSVHNYVPVLIEWPGESTIETYMLLLQNLSRTGPTYIYYLIFIIILLK